MNYLVDTHIFLWILFEPKNLSKKEKNTLLDPEKTKFVSVITFWEISLKFSLGKLNLTGVLPDELPAFAKETGFAFLPLDIQTASSLYKLPKIQNKDPFDRMLAWQAIKKDWGFFTRDKDFIAYKEYGLKLVR